MGLLQRREAGGRRQGAWQYDDEDLERLSMIMTLSAIGFEKERNRTVYGTVLERGYHVGRTVADFTEKARPDVRRDSYSGKAVRKSGLSAI